MTTGAFSDQTQGAGGPPPLPGPGAVPVGASCTRSPAGRGSRAGPPHPRRHEPPVGCPWALGAGQAWPINRGLPGARGSALQASDPGHRLCSGMAAPRALWAALVLLGVLQTQAQVSVQPGFQQDKFLGRWFSVGLASNASWFLKKKALLSTCKSVVTPTEDGGLNITFTSLRKNQCETRTMLLQPAGGPGTYNYRSAHWGSSHVVSVVETNYEEYALLYSQGAEGSSQDFRMATLYSRTQTPRAELKEKFAAFCQAQGFTEDAVVFLPRNDKCLTEQD